MIELTAGVSGEFRIEKRSHGILTEVRRFDNLVMTGPFSKLIADLRGNDAWQNAQYLFLGTGDSEPTPTDTGLEQRSAIPGKLTSAQTFGQWVDPPNGERWADVTLQFDYAVDEATGDEWTEIGAADDGAYTTPYNRALIRDENGVPTPLVVMSDEAVTVYLTLRLREGLGFPVQGVTNYLGKEVGFTLTPLNARAWTTAGYNPWQVGYAHRVIRLLNAGGGRLSMQTVDTRMPWPYPPGSAPVTIYPEQTYTHRLAERRTQVDYTLQDTNEDVEIHGIEFGPTTDEADRIYLLEFDEPLVKPAYDTLTFQAAITFTREDD